MNERQIELTWRCSSCEHANLGRHLVCHSCGNPKDDGEQYEMPSDASRAPSVTDAKLLALARAGANWRCRYCDSDARAPDGSCAQCGGGRAPARPGSAPARSVARPRAAWVLPAAVASVGFLVITGGLVATRSTRAPAQVAPSAPGFHDVQARTDAASWRHAVQVQRWQIVAREGFAEQQPPDAMDVTPGEERVHHVDKVEDGTMTETYTDQETRMVSESYSDKERCGETCTDRPPVCRQQCTNNQNGFATCRDVCSGGGRDCSPKYCTVQKTRTVSKTTPVQKTRTVPKFKSVPRMARWLSWKVWDWAPARTVEAKGVGFETRWPSDEEITLGRALGPGEKEREQRFTDYRVDLLGDDGTRHQVIPGSLDAYRSYEGARAVLRVHGHGRIEMIGQPTPAVQVASARPSSQP